MAPTSPAQWSAWRAPELPPVEQVRPGIWSIPVPLPTNLRYVLVYAFETSDGLGIVDVGWDSAAAWQALCDGITATGHAVSDVQWALVTHVHRDHYGLGARLQQVAGTRVAMHPKEAETLESRHAPVETQRAEYFAWMRNCGVPDADAPAMLPGSLSGAEPLPMPDPDLLLEDGDLTPLAGWAVTALWTPGHTPGHLCFVEPRHQLMLSGDHVLPHITPNISASPRNRNPLHDFRESLVRCRGLGSAEVLPAHEYRFAGLDERLAYLEVHHDERLQHLFEQVRDNDGWTTWQLTEVGQWSRPWSTIAPDSRRLALGEAESHLMALAGQGRIVWSEDQGPIRWSATTSNRVERT